MNITQLEKQMIRNIARSEYTPINGDIPQNYHETETWTNVVVVTNEDKGVLSSLIKKGLVAHQDEGRDSIIWLTQEGFEEYKKLES